MGPTWVLSAPDGPHDGPMNLAIMVVFQSEKVRNISIFLSVCYHSSCCLYLFFVSASFFINFVVYFLFVYFVHFVLHLYILFFYCFHFVSCFFFVISLFLFIFYASASICVFLSFIYSFFHFINFFSRSTPVSFFLFSLSFHRFHFITKHKHYFSTFIQLREITLSLLKLSYKIS